MIQTEATGDAMTEKSGEHIPVATRTERLRIGAASVLVHVLDDGRRIIDANDMAALLQCLGDFSDEPASDAGA